MESNTVKDSENITANLLFYGRQSNSFDTMMMTYGELH